MTDEEHEMLKRTHDFWFVSEIKKRPSRAEQIDDVLSGVRAGKLGLRVVLYLAGVIAAIGAAFAAIKGAFHK